MCIKDCALSLTCQKCSYYAHIHRRRPRSKCTIPSLQYLEVSLYRRTPGRGVRRWRIYYEYCPFRKIVKFYNSGVSNSVCLLLALAQRKGFKNVKYFLNKLPYEFPRHYTWTHVLKIIKSIKTAKVFLKVHFNICTKSAFFFKLRTFTVFREKVE